MLHDALAGVMSAEATTAPGDIACAWPTFSHGYVTHSVHTRRLLHIALCSCAFVDVMTVGLERTYAHLDATGPLVRRAVLGLLRVAARLLAAQDDVADALLRSLNLLPRLHPNVAWELAEPIAQQASSSFAACRWQISKWWRLTH